MGTIVVRRLGRRPEPQTPSGELLLEAPPELPDAGGAGWQQMMMGLPMLAGSVAMALMYASYRTGPLMYVTGGMFGVSAIGMLGAQFMFSGGQSKRAMRGARAEYMRYLAQQRGKVRRTIAAQRAALEYRYPEPSALWAFPAGPRLWERRPHDGDFASVRIGLGPRPLATPIVPPETRPLDRLEPMCAGALRRFVTTYAVVEDLPVLLLLDGFSRVYLRGDPERCRALVRAVVAHAATFHAPDDLLVAVCADQASREHWEWVKWLPHALHPTRTDALGRRRLVSETVTGLEALLDDVVAGRPRFDPAASSGRVGRHVLLVLDGGSVTGSDILMTEGGIEGVTLLDLSSPAPRALDYSAVVLDLAAGGGLVSQVVGRRSEMGRADGLSAAEAWSLARQLAPLRLSEPRRAELTMSEETSLTELLGVGDPYALDTAQTWQPRPSRDRLRVPIGVAPDGTLVDLDLKESALDGMGPHGLVIGATGSGKSELLRTLVLALASTHDSETLNFVLVDFKGGATFTKLDRLPHTSAVITNLADELPLVDRMTDAINGELLRRQELLRSAGNFDSQRDYEKARLTGAPLRPLPSLMIICDEFSELLSAKPDFIEMFVQIGRVGRSLGIHLLLASQRLEEGRLRGLDTHLSYRIGLRTFTAMESRVVLGTPAAAELPRLPGHGYLKYGIEAMTRFRAAYVSGVYRREATALAAAAAGTAIVGYSTQYQAPVQTADVITASPEEIDEDSAGPSLLDILVERLQGRGTPAHQVWLPPLGEPDPLDALLPPLAVHPRRGLTTLDERAHGALVAAVGTVDRPLEQRRDVLALDLSGAGGHAIVIGGPRSGRSTLLRNAVTSLALTHTPAEAQFYVLDFGGGGFAGLRRLPHVGGVASRLEPGPVRRTVAEVLTVLLAREKLFAGLGVESMAAYRRMRREGRLPPEAGEDRFGDVFLVVDGWGSVRIDFEELEPALTEIATRGLSYGVHLLVSAGRWTELRPAVRDMLSTRLELRLGDPTDSVLGRRAAMNVPEDTPGRGLTPDGHHFLSALPRIDGGSGLDDLPEATAALIGAVRDNWGGPSAPPVRLLPSRFPYADLPLDDPRPGIPIGVAEDDLGPVLLEVHSEPHVLLYGDVESGKTAFLRAYAQAVVDRYSPEEARVIIVDYRRGLLGAVPPSHLIGFGHTAPEATTILTEVHQVMQARLPSRDVTPEQLRERSWWTGPDLFVLVDDYDLVSGASNPVAILHELLPQARDIGLHVALVRRTGGASRALFEPVTSTLRDLSSPGILLSGDRNEGPLVGQLRPSVQPPGRGWLVTRRGGARLVQLAWLAPDVNGG